jgi:hypothetical protein
MSENSKVSAFHRQRAAIVYVRQSTLGQLERNRESTTRQYDLVDKAVALGWPRSAVRVVDEDQGISGSSTMGRSGFADIAAQVGLGQVGIVLALEVSRLAGNNADWYRLLDPGRDDRHVDRRCRRPVPPGPVQRPSGPWHERHDV